MLRRLTVLALVALSLAAPGCYGPSVPVPPPDPGIMSFGLDAETGTTTYRAGPDPNWGGARVSVYDETTGEGVITTAAADGSVAETRPFPANDGDRVFVIYEIADQASGQCLILRNGPSSQTLRCP